MTDESDVKVKRLAPAESVPSLSFGENIPEGGGSGGLSPLYGVKGEFGTRPISPALFDVLNRGKLVTVKYLILHLFVYYISYSNLGKKCP